MPASAVYNRFWRWARNGIRPCWSAGVRVITEAIDELTREASADSSIVRAHQHTADARHRPRAHTGGRRAGSWQTEPDDHAIARSLSVLLTSGNINDLHSVHPGHHLHPHAPPQRSAMHPAARVIADKAYSARAIRTYLRRRAIACTIRNARDQQTNRRRRGPAGGRPPAFDPIVYRRRDVVERFNRSKHYRAIATRRCDKTALSYNAWLDLVATLMWLEDTAKPSPAVGARHGGNRLIVAYCCSYTPTRTMP